MFIQKLDMMKLIKNYKIATYECQRTRKNRLIRRGIDAVDIDAASGDNEKVPIFRTNGPFGAYQSQAFAVHSFNLPTLLGNLCRKVSTSP